MALIITAWTHTHTLAQLHAWLDYHSWHDDVQQSDGRIQTHHGVFDRVNQADDVGSPSQVFKDFDFPFDFLLLDGLWFQKNKDTFNITKINKRLNEVLQGDAAFRYLNTLKPKYYKSSFKDTSQDNKIPKLNPPEYPWR